MSDALTHECGLAFVRLRKPISFFQKERGDALWGLRKLYLLMEKQHNRGQDGAGIACVKFDMPAGDAFLERERTAKRNPIERLFDDALSPARRLGEAEMNSLGETALKRQFPLLGEVLLGHLRYGTHSGNSSAMCHPYLRRSNAESRSIAMAGNFNLTNSSELFRKLVEYGLHPVGDSDTGVVLEKIGYFIDREHAHLEATMGEGSFLNLSGSELMAEVSRQLDLARVLRKATEVFDGGYVFAGILGNGDSFVCRDPAGIRPGFFLVNDDCIAVASERAALSTVFNTDPRDIEPIPPGHAIIIKKSGEYSIERFAEPLPLRQCTFERIYFSRGNDPSIYRERKQLGRNLAPRIVDMLGGDLDRAVFGFIPNTSETSYYGLVEALGEERQKMSAETIWRQVQAGTATRESILAALDGRVRAEKVAHKDQRLRTFITHDAARKDLVNHIYDITRGTVFPDDTLVVVDDSIVRGTTLRESIITMLARLNPKGIIVASASPPIMYPDCYGIDMSQLGRFIAFEAAVGLARDTGQAGVLDEIEAKCLEQAALPPDRMKNHVGLLYGLFSLGQIERKVAELIRSKSLAWSGEIRLAYQSVEGLRMSMPDHTGDWYFTGEYPTPGGYRVLNTAYLNWRRGADGRRAY
ncbi:MAG: amidophosphoribosyltransferase [Phycisphaerales bacterium]|jgi:amidophosphoribosyltransferase